MPNESLRVPAFCPMCEMLMKGKSVKTYYDYGVCMTCFIQFVEGREEAWKSGERPTEEQIKSYIDSLLRTS